MTTGGMRKQKSCAEDWGYSPLGCYATLLLVCFHGFDSSFNPHSGASYCSNGCYGQSSGPLLVSNVQCTGFESSLLECTHDQETHSGCNSFDDVGVQCSGMLLVLQFYSSSL